MKRLIRIVESGEKTAFIQTKKGIKKAVDYMTDQELKGIADNSDIQSVVTASGATIKEEKKEYTTEESTAVGREVGKSLIKVMRAQGDSLKSVSLANMGINRFSVKVEYGEGRGQDVFKFRLNTNTQKIEFESEDGIDELSNFMITQGNKVSLNAPELESKLSEALKKYVSEPTDVPDEGSIEEKLSPTAKPETYIKDFAKSKAPQFKGKSKEKRREMAIAAYMSNQLKEDVNSVPLSELKDLIVEAYIEVLREENGATLKTSTQEILGKFPTLRKAITSLMTADFPDFITDVKWVAPKPSTFQVGLQNGQNYLLKWMGKGFEAQIAGKKYYLNSVSQYQQALDKLNSILKTGPIVNPEMQDAEDNFSGAPAGGGDFAGFDEFPQEPTTPDKESDKESDKETKKDTEK